MRNDCVFCAIAAGEIPAYVVHEDADLIAFLAADPLNPGHTLIAPKAHAEGLYDLPEDTAARILPLAKVLAARIRDAFGCDGLNVMQNNGAAAGQSVMHFHLHLIPRYADDGAVRWGATQKPARAQFEADLERLRGARPLS